MKWTLVSHIYYIYTQSDDKPFICGNSNLYVQIFMEESFVIYSIYILITLKIIEFWAKYFHGK